MTQQDFLNLRNGAEVIGVARENLSGEPVTLTAEALRQIAKAFCTWLVSRTGKTRVTVAIGHDSRRSSPDLCEAVTEGILSTGHNAVVTGLATTPSTFAILKDATRTGDAHCHGSIMITANGFPCHFNGMQFFSQNGVLQDTDVKEILSLCANYRFPENIRGTRTDFPYLKSYAATLVEKVRATTGDETPLHGKRILVCAENSVNGFFINEVLIPLGAEVKETQLVKETATNAFCAAVLEQKADLGIAFDITQNGAFVVDKYGKPLHGNRLIALLSAILLEERVGTIVTDPTVSETLTAFIESRGGKITRVQCGLQNLIHEAIRLNESGEYAPIAMESNGKTAFFENYFLEDTAHLLIRILIALVKLDKDGKDLTDCIADWTPPTEETEIRLSFTESEHYHTQKEKLFDALTAYAENNVYARIDENAREGLRLLYDDRKGDGCAFIRANAQERVLILGLESNKKDGLVKIVKDLYYCLRSYEYLHVTPLKEFVEAWRVNKISEVNDRFVACGKITAK